MRKFFYVGDRVQISKSFTWARNTRGTIGKQKWVWMKGKDGTVNADEIMRETIGADSKIHVSYYVEFDIPQIDADGDGPYYAAEIDAEYLELIT